MYKYEKKAPDNQSKIFFIIELFANISVYALNYY